MNEEDFRYLYRHLDATHKRKITRLDAKGDHYFQLTFWIVWEWATKQEWWEEFLESKTSFLFVTKAEEVSTELRGIIHPTHFPQLITDFLREKGEGDGRQKHSTP